jgi:thymidylate synthase (FAD)
MSKSGIVTEPRVILVGSTQFHLPGLHEFVEAENLQAIAADPASPLAKIIAAVENDGPYTSPELMPEFGGRFCYESWAKGRTTPEYNENILEDAHGSVLAHSTVNVVITGVSRSLTHELIRHAAGIAISQQSQRYVDMGNPLFVIPPGIMHYSGIDSQDAVEWLHDQQETLISYGKWQEYMREAITHDVSLEDAFVKSVRKKRANEAARGSLPNSIETKMLWTVNIRALRHVVEMRGDDSADLEIRRLAVEFAKLGQRAAPTLFDDVTFGEGDFGVGTVTTKHRKV